MTIDNRQLAFLFRIILWSQKGAVPFVMTKYFLSSSVNSNIGSKATRFRRYKSYHKCERALMVDLDALVYHCSEMKGIKLATQ